MPNYHPKTDHLKPPGFTDEQRAKGVATRQAKARDRQTKYLNALVEGKRIGQAAASAGVQRADVYRWRKADPEFAEAEKRAEQAFADTVESVVLESALSGNMPAAFRWLEQRSQERWTPPAKQVEVKQTLELEAGPRIERIMALQAKILERQALTVGSDPNIIDVDPVDEEG